MSACLCTLSTPFPPHNMSKDNSWFGRKKAQAQQDNLVKEDRKQKEKLGVRYRIARIDFDIHCLKIGVIETPVMEYSQNGIEPVCKLFPVSAPEAEQRIEQLQKLKKDLQMMAAKQLGLSMPEQTDGAGLIGVDGAPLADQGQDAQDDGTNTESPSQGDGEGEQGVSQ